MSIEINWKNVRYRTDPLHAETPILLPMGSFSIQHAAEARESGLWPSNPNFRQASFHHIRYILFLCLLEKKAWTNEIKSTMEGKVAAFKICCTEWSGTLYSVYNDIRKQRSERLAIDTSEIFLPSFTEITLSIVMVFFFVLLWFFCFIFKRS